MIGYLTCSACHDTWCRDMIDQEVQAYIEANPELKRYILSGEITDVDLGEVLCDGCEDFFNDEAEAQAQDDPDSDDDQPLEDEDALPTETIKCPYCGRLNSELYCQCMEEDPADEDDTDSDSASWLCENCGDPAYDCLCDEARLDGEGVVDIEDEIDRKVELMRLGRM